MNAPFKSLLLFVVLLLFICSCKQNTKTEHLPPNKKLISFKSKLAFTSDDLDKLDTNLYKKIISNRFNKETDTIRYSKGKIYISYLKATSGCSEYVGDIKFNKDTLKLLLNNASDTVCSERNVCRVIYEIENKRNKSYLIEKD